MSQDKEHQDFTNENEQGIEEIAHQIHEHVSLFSNSEQQEKIADRDMPKIIKNADHLENIKQFLAQILNCYNNIKSANDVSDNTAPAVNHFSMKLSTILQYSDHAINHINALEDYLVTHDLINTDKLFINFLSMLNRDSDHYHQISIICKDYIDRLKEQLLQDYADLLSIREDFSNNKMEYTIAYEKYTGIYQKLMLLRDELQQMENPVIGSSEEAEVFARTEHYLEQFNNEKPEQIAQSKSTLEDIKDESALQFLKAQQEALSESTISDKKPHFKPKL